MAAQLLFTAAGPDVHAGRRRWSCSAANGSQLCALTSDAGGGVRPRRGHGRRPAASTSSTHEPAELVPAGRPTATRARAGARGRSARATMQLGSVAVSPRRATRAAGGRRRTASACTWRRWRRGGELGEPRADQPGRRPERPADGAQLGRPRRPVGRRPRSRRAPAAAAGGRHGRAAGGQGRRSWTARGSRRCGWPPTACGSRCCVTQDGKTTLHIGRVERRGPRRPTRRSRSTDLRPAAPQLEDVDGHVLGGRQPARGGRQGVGRCAAGAVRAGGRLHARTPAPCRA